MGYFQNPVDDPDPERRQLWQAVIDEQIKKWPEPHQKRLADLEHHLEAKALYIFTRLRRFVQGTKYLGEAANGGWKAVYVEGYALMLSAIEMAGKAVYLIDETVYQKGQPSSAQFLTAGLYSLNSPDELPVLRDEVMKAKKVDKIIELERDTKLDLPYSEGRQPKIGELIQIRNYVMHGASDVDLKNFSAHSTNYQHPRALAIQCEKAMRKYWLNLKADTGEINGWVDRLRKAKICPFPIPGSTDPNFQKCLIDPNIVDYLNDKKCSIFSENNC